LCIEWEHGLVPNNPQSNSAIVDKPVLSTGVARGLLIGTTALIAVSIIFPRSTSTNFIVPLVLALTFGWDNRQQPTFKELSSNRLLMIFGVFATWALLSAVWSFAPKATLTKPPYLIAGIIGTACTVWLARKAPREILVPIGQGVVLGLLCGGEFVAFEIWTSQALQRFVLNIGGPFPDRIEKHFEIRNGIVINISEANLKRRTTLVSLLLLPGTALAYMLLRDRLRWAVLTAYAAVAVTVLLYSRHQSAQVAVVAAACTFGLANLSLRGTRSIAVAAWCVAAMLVVPVVVWAHSTGIHKQPDKLFYSARHRLVIWNHTAKQIPKSPLFGIGADATASYTGAVEKALVEKGERPPKDGEFDVSTASHAHNAFLQMWSELGAIGATLFAVLGIATVGAIGRMRATVQPLLLAQFAAVAGMIGFSFSIWQLWFQGAIGLGMLASLLVVWLDERERT
jgi:O-antigen ligase